MKTTNKTLNLCPLFTEEKILCKVVSTLSFIQSHVFDSRLYLLDWLCTVSHVSVIAQNGIKQNSNQTAFCSLHYLVADTELLCFPHTYVYEGGRSNYNYYQNNLLSSELLFNAYLLQQSQSFENILSLTKYYI